MSGEGSPTTVKSGDFEKVSDLLGFLLTRKGLIDGRGREEFLRYYHSYARHFGKYIRFHYDNQLREITEAIGRRRGVRILEVGSGCGTDALWFSMKGASVVSVDPSEERLDVARALRRGFEGLMHKKLPLEFIPVSILDFRGQEGSFDIVWMKQTFHHIEPRDLLYEAVAKQLAPGGSVIVSETNAWNPLMEIALLLKRGTKTIWKRNNAERKSYLYGNERIVLPSFMARGFARARISKAGVRYFRALPNVRVADFMLGAEKLLPVFLAPFFLHYTYVGIKSKGQGDE